MGSTSDSQTWSDEPNSGANKLYVVKEMEGLQQGLNDKFVSQRKVITFDDSWSFVEVERCEVDWRTMVTGTNSGSHVTLESRKRRLTLTRRLMRSWI